jgi:hypothetical protein
LIGVCVFLGMVGILAIGVEYLRWTTRPAARRRRVLKKIGGQR